MASPRRPPLRLVGGTLCVTRLSRHLQITLLTMYLLRISQSWRGAVANRGLSHAHRGGFHKYWGFQKPLQDLAQICAILLGFTG
jgi:hypothetical protein